MFGYQADLQTGAVAELESLSLKITHREPEGPPAATLLNATVGGRALPEYLVRPRFINGVYGLGRTRSNMFFILGEWTGGGPPMFGQLDYWWTHMVPQDGLFSCAENRGMFLPDLVHV